MHSTQRNGQTHNTELRRGRRSWTPQIILALFTALILTGCLTATPTITPGPLQSPTPTPLPTSTPTPVPFGDPANPLVFGVITSNPDQEAGANTLAEQLTQVSGLAVRAETFSDYQQLLTELSERRVHIVWLPPLTYVYASHLGIAEVALLANHFGVYQYGSQFLANTSSAFTVFFDPVSGRNTADADAALAQFNGLRPCWAEPGSVSGYVVPAGLLAANGIAAGTPAYTQSHSGVVRSLYVKGVCDFGATFSISGDPRTAAAVLNDLPDALERIPIIWRSDAIIPNLSIAYVSGLTEDRSKALTAGFLQIAQNAEGRPLLTASAGGYEVDALKAIDDSIYDPLRDLTDALDLNPRELIGR